MGVSERAASFVLGLISVILRLAFATGDRDGSINAFQEDILQQIPMTLQTALSRFKIDGKMTTYAVCPRCHCTYEPQILRGSANLRYPAVCTNTPNPSLGVCAEPLLQSTGKPLKTFEFHSFHDYLAGLLSRSDLESLMDQSCEDFKERLQTSPRLFTTEVFEAEFANKFEGPTPGELFLNGGDEGRYAFSLNVDFFNVEGMRVRGASTSCGIISMACLNLPIDIRYKPENLYLAGIIPGPREPHQTELNHYLRPLIDDMSISWEQGVHISRTALRPEGRTTRCAVFAAVNDLPGARKLAALAPPTSHWYCSVCKCRNKTNLGNYDHENWDKRDVEECRKAAESWKNAKDLKEQDRIFQETGHRWSEMWRLPYWDPSRQLVIDAMHCVMEGLVQLHFREGLQLTTVASGFNPESRPAFDYNFRLINESENTHGMNPEELKAVIAIHKALRAPIQGKTPEQINESVTRLSKSLLGRNLKPLGFVGGSLEVSFNKNRVFKKDWVEELIVWVSSSVQFFATSIQSNIPFKRMKQPLIRPSKQLRTSDPAVMAHIRVVIKTTSTPSWINSVPYNFGDSSAGTLKAHEWRTLATIYLPIALVTAWGEGSHHESPELAAKFGAVLDHTMELVSAVCLVCRRSINPSRATAYLNCITKYVKDIHTFFPNVTYRPNHHAAFHIYDFMLLFGPVHSWWCFPFERLIGILQRMPSNHHFGKFLSLAYSSVC